MSSRARGRRDAQASSEPSPPPDISTLRARVRSRKGNGDIKPLPNGEILEDEQGEPVAGPSRRTPGKARGSRRRKARQKVRIELDGEADAEGETDEAEGEEEKAVRKRMRKSVSYKEVAVELGEEEEDDVEEDAVGQEVEVQVDAKRVASRSASATPKKGRVRPPNADLEPDSDDADKSYGRDGMEKVGSGRGGFSVKGAASAAARARWDRVRKDRAERGDESDEGERVKRTKLPGKKDSRAAAESFEMDTMITIKGTEYMIGDDEVILPDDEKGDAKVDEEGRLLGGREYKLVTFTSETRRNPERVYALTIDAARACGYADSLAFLRRCPQVIKLGCNADERQMLIDIGRVTGNLKHRMVTMVTMRNVYKLMGARVVKSGSSRHAHRGLGADGFAAGKWVTDDYYEDEALAKCEANGFTPYATAYEDEIIANAMTSMQPQGRPSQNVSTDQVAQRPAVSLAPFYTLGGPTTQFAGNGADPWSEAGWGNKRGKLRGQGVGEEDWMLRTAMDCRRIDRELKETREERLKVLEGVDATKGWVYAMEEGTERGDGNDGYLKAAAPGMERKRSGLSQEVTFGPIPVDENAPEPRRENGSLLPELEKTPGGTIVVRKPEEEDRGSGIWRWGVGREWKPGVIRAAYEPHTHMPHIPLVTQPRGATLTRIAPFPVLTSLSDSQHKNFVQSTITGRAARGLSSVEYVLESREHAPEIWDVRLDPLVNGKEERKRRLKEVEDAVEWEREIRGRRREA